MKKKSIFLKTTVMASVYDHNTQLVGPGGSRVQFSLLLDLFKTNSDYTAWIWNLGVCYLSLLVLWIALL